MDLALRDVLGIDLPIFYRHQIDPIAVRMAAFTSRGEKAFMAHWHENVLADDVVVKKTIVFEGLVVGFVVSFERAGLREIGYWIAREFWGKGIATDALRRFLECDPRRPLHAVVAQHNTASLRVLEKCGFVTERVKRGSAGAPGRAVDELVLTLE